MIFDQKFSLHLKDLDNGFVFNWIWGGCAQGLVLPCLPLGGLQASQTLGHS